MIFFCFSKKFGFGIFLVHLPMASVLLSASVERCFVSRMRNFFIYGFSSGLVVSGGVLVVGGGSFWGHWGGCLHYTTE